MNVKNLLHCLYGTDDFCFKVEIGASLMKTMSESLFEAAKSLDRLHILLFEHKCAGYYVDRLDVVVPFFILYTDVIIAFEKSRQVCF